MAMTQTKARLFGTDGVRGRANEVLTVELATSLGRAAACYLKPKTNTAPSALLIRDTRESGQMIETALAAGICSAGGDVFLGGVLPTPAASLLTIRHGFDFACVISASHNPYYDNGVKIFNSDGLKLSDSEEDEIESLLGQGVDGSTRCGRIEKLEGARADYKRELLGHFKLDLAGTSIILDCANGATYQLAPEVFCELGAEVTTLACEPDGCNINEGVGSTHIGNLAAAVTDMGAAMGFAFDGDGDRVLAVDSKGDLIDGDELLALSALYLKGEGRLTGDGVAVTVMSNLGFKRALAAEGIEVEMTKVGDRYVSEALGQRGWSLGGEQSGHLIYTGFNPTGDGIAGALLALQAMRSLGYDPVQKRIIEKLPQALENVEVADLGHLNTADRLWQEVEEINNSLAGEGRVLVRSSGTEAVVRVMVEAPTAAQSREICTRLSSLVKELLS